MWKPRIAHHSTAYCAKPRCSFGALIVVIAAHAAVLAHFSLRLPQRIQPEFQPSLQMVDILAAEPSVAGDLRPELSPDVAKIEEPEIDVPMPELEIEIEPASTPIGVVYTDAPQRPRPVGPNDACDRIALQFTLTQRYDPELFRRMQACRALLEGATDGA